MHYLKLCFCFCILFLISSLSNAATLTSQVDRNQINQNETLNLTVTYTDNIEADRLNTSALLTDFDILSSNPQSSNRVSIVNGKTTSESTTTWSIMLAPKKKGILTIPGFEINGQKSNPIRINVNDSPKNKATNQPISVSVKADRKSAYPTQQIIISIRLSAAANVSSLQGEPLRIDNAQVELLGQQENQEINNGIARQVVEWRYAVFADQSGSITIPAQTFSGIVGARRSFFDSFGSRGQRVGGRSDSVTININPKPQSENRAWFPASQVNINSNWSSDIQQIKVGEPITRTITITAQGQLASTIPPLMSDNNTSYKSYADQPKLDKQLSDNGITGIRQESLAIIPASSGELTLPEKEIHWWNTKTKQWQTSVLPAETIQVIASDQSTSPTVNTNSNSSTALDIKESSRSYTLWQWSTLALGSLCLIQFIFLLRLRTKNSNTLQVDHNYSNNEKQAWSELRKALKTNDAGLIRRQIISWANLATDSQQTVTNLGAFATLANNENLSEQLSLLDRAIFKESVELNFDQLDKTLQLTRKELINSKANPTIQENKLKSLYPI